MINANKGSDHGKGAASLPAGVVVRPLEAHGDERGSLTELFRSQWGLGEDPVQWNVQRTQSNVLRGVHVHLRHDDYVILLEGRVSVGLRDLRVGSPSEGRAGLVELLGRQPAGVLIPRGVAHGFYFHQPSLHVFSMTKYWDPEDDKACLWTDPALEIPWPVSEARLSERDASAPPLSGLLAELGPFQPIGAPVAPVEA